VTVNLGLVIVWVAIALIVGIIIGLMWERYG
jgi:uncharacterized protein YneF (UPF0154 family)